MKSLSLTTFAALTLLLGACDQPDPATGRQEGQYGSSSGPNPNLEDLQAQTPQNGATATPAPASPAESAYPSQAGKAPPPPVDGGRGSAATGATSATDQN